jgi:hypothetical protein
VSEPPKPLEIFEDNRSPSIRDTIYVAGQPLNLTGKSVKFRMRLKDGEALKVDSAAQLESPLTSGKVRYDWAAADTDTPGAYVFWWNVVISAGVEQDTEEHRLDIIGHIPGGDVALGGIARRVKALMPVTYDALVESERFGEDGLQLHIDSVKAMLFGTSVPANQEEIEYSDNVLWFAARIVALRLIPVAIDWWSNQPQSLTTTGTNESVSYPNRVDSLLKLLDSLRRDTRFGRLVLQGGEWVVVFLTPGGSPKISHKQTNKITPDPWTFPAPECVPLYVGGSGLLVERHRYW